MSIQVPRAITGFIARERDGCPARLDLLGEALQARLTGAIRDVGQPAHDIKDFLNGTYLGVGASLAAVAAVVACTR